MKVAFWDGINMCDDVTGNLAAISTFCTINYGKKVFLSSNHISSRTLEDYYFSSSTKSGRERITQYVFYGEPEYFRKLWEGKKQKQTELITMEGIHLLGLPDLLEHRMFYRSVQKETLYFMDVSGGMNASVQKALEEADIVVVFLPQNTVEICKFFDMYSSIIPKAIFLIVDYRVNMGCEPKYLIRKFGIQKECAGVIPYCEAYLQASEEGEVEHFIRTNLKLEENHENFYFMKCIERASEMILNYKENKEAYELSE